MMKVNAKKFCNKNLSFTIRLAVENDAKDLSEIRLQIDGETENLDREPGESYIDESGFKQLIFEDTEQDHNLFLVCEANGKIVGFSRCEGNTLRRKSHIVEFGVCVLQKYWGYGIGTHLLIKTLEWADSIDIKKITLKVLETNDHAIKLYEKYGFEQEGILKKDKLLSDGNYYNTILMARFKG